MIAKISFPLLLLARVGALVLLVPTLSADETIPARPDQSRPDKWAAYERKLEASHDLEGDPPAEIRDIVREAAVAFAKNPENRDIEGALASSCTFLRKPEGAAILQEVRAELRAGPRGDFLFAQLIVDLSRRLGPALPEGGWESLDELVDLVLQEEPGHEEATMVRMHQAFIKKRNITDLLPSLRKVREKHGPRAMFTAILYAPRFTERLPPAGWTAPLVALVTETEPDGDGSAYDLSNLSAFTFKMIPPDDHDSLRSYVKWIKTLPRRKSIKLTGVTIRLMQDGLHADLIDWLRYLHNDRDDEAEDAAGDRPPNILEVPPAISLKPDDLTLWNYLNDHELVDDLAAALGEHTTSRYKLGTKACLTLLSPGPPRERAEAAIAVLVASAANHQRPVSGYSLAQLQLLADKVAPQNGLASELNAAMTRMGLAKYLGDLSKLPKTAIDTNDPDLLRTAWEALQERTGQRVSSTESKAMIEAHLSVAGNEDWTRFLDEARQVLLPAGPESWIEALRSQRAMHPTRSADVLRMLSEESLMEYIRTRGAMAGWDIVLLAQVAGLTDLSAKIEHTLTDISESRPLLAELLAASRGKADYLRPVCACRWTGRNHTLNWSLLGVTPPGGPNLAVLPPQAAKFDGRFDLEILAGAHDQLFRRISTVPNADMTGSLELEPKALEGCRWIAISIRERNGEIVRQGPSSRVPSASPGRAVLSASFEAREGGGPFGDAAWHHSIPMDADSAETKLTMADLDWTPGQNGWVSLWARASPPLTVSLTGIDRQGRHCGYSRSEGRTQIVGRGGDCWHLIQIPIQSSMLPDKATSLRLQGSFTTPGVGRGTIQLAGLHLDWGPPSEHDPRLTLLGRVPGAVSLATGREGGLWFVMDDGSLAHTPRGSLELEKKLDGPGDFSRDQNHWLFVRPTGVFLVSPKRSLTWYDEANGANGSLPRELGEAGRVWISNDGTILAAVTDGTTVVGRLESGPDGGKFTEIARCKTPGPPHFDHQEDELLISDRITEWRLNLKNEKLTGPVDIPDPPSPDRKRQGFGSRLWMDPNCNLNVSLTNDDLTVDHNKYPLLGKPKSVTLRDSNLIVLDRFGLVYSLPTKLP